MKLGVTTICPHILWDGKWWSYEPFVREMDIWAELFDELVMIAPEEDGPPPQLWAPYAESTYISVIPFWKNRGQGLEQPKIGIGDLPGMIAALVKSAGRCDAYHLRSPANISLLGSLLLPVWSKKICAKYAGAWPKIPGEAFSYRVQKKILSSGWFSGPVTVYGEWPRQPAHIKPFFTSVMDTRQVELAKTACMNKHIHSPLRIIFVGRLSSAKNVDVLIASIGKLVNEEIPVEVRIIGDGPELLTLKQQSASLGMPESIIGFMGGMSFEEVLGNYEWADVLVLASETEGWPKAIAEGMAFGLVCIGSNRGLVPQMLADGRGLVVEPGDPYALATALKTIASGELDFECVSSLAAKWSQRYSLDGLKIALRELLITEWQLEMDALG